MAQYQMPLSHTMKTNIDVILNQDYIVGWGEVWRQSGINITRRPRSSIMDIDLTFFGRHVVTDQDFELVPSEVTRINIVQDFEGHYCDDITVVCTLTAEQLLTVLDNYRNMQCKIIMRERDPNSSFVDYTLPIYDETFKVIIKDKDLRKRVSKQALIPDSNLDKNGEHQEQMFSNIEFQLIKEEAYLFRKKKFNFQARDVTVRDTICFLAQCCDVKKISLVEPDNKQVYKNLIIPPQHTFLTCMEFLQEYYGVYEKGLGYYFMDDTLYVYPIYETKPTTPESAHLYLAGPESSSGSSTFHAFSDKICHIVISSTPVVRDLVDGGLENYGDAVLFQHADRMIDLASTIGEGEGSVSARMGLGKIDLKEPNTSMYAFKEDNMGIMDDAYNPMFRFDGSNQYKYRSEMNAYKRSLVGVQWKVAQPGVFKPGYLLHWHFDGEDITRRAQGELFGNSAEYQTRSGVCQRVTYDLRPAKAKEANKNYPYACTADVILSIEFEPGKIPTAKWINTYGVATSALTKAAETRDKVTSSINSLQTLASQTISHQLSQVTASSFGSAVVSGITDPSINVFTKMLSSVIRSTSSGLNKSIKGLFNL